MKAIFSIMLMFLVIGFTDASPGSGIDDQNQNQFVTVYDVATGDIAVIDYVFSGVDVTTSLGTVDYVNSNEILFMPCETNTFGINQRPLQYRPQGFQNNSFNTNYLQEKNSNYQSPYLDLRNVNRIRYLYKE